MRKGDREERVAEDGKIGRNNWGKGREEKPTRASR